MSRVWYSRTLSEDIFILHFYRLIINIERFLLLSRIWLSMIILFRSTILFLIRGIFHNNISNVEWLHCIIGKNFFSDLCLIFSFFDFFVDLEKFLWEVIDSIFWGKTLEFVCEWLWGLFFWNSATTACKKIDGLSNLHFKHCTTSLDVI